MKDEELDKVLFELEQAQSIEIEDETVGTISIFQGGWSSLLCC